jgi:hypothetical protein
MTKKKEPIDSVREERFEMEIVVDAYDSEERATGWYCYLDDRLAFPFSATCIRQLETSPLDKGQVVEVIGMAKEDDCRDEIRVRIRFGRRTLAVPLAQLRPTTTDGKTLQAAGDWHYRVERGYSF